MVDRILDSLKLPSAIYSSFNSSGSQKKRPPRHILSVDMGIKNFAVCLLTIPDGSYSSRCSVPTPDITAWQNFSVLERYMAGTIEHMSGSKRTKESESSIFQSDRFAPIALRLAKELVSNYKPDIILLEKQRHRSMGGRNILEWTVRVNMLENMLQAVFRMLIENDSWKNGNVVSLDPKRVFRYWLDDLKTTRGKAATTKSRTYHAVKSAKKSIVEEWLSEQHRGQVEAPFRLDKSLECLAISFTRKRKSAKTPGDSKIDDLTDCLLQGLAFMKWEHNRLKLREGNIDELD